MIVDTVILKRAIENVELKHVNEKSTIQQLTASETRQLKRYAMVDDIEHLMKHENIFREYTKLSFTGQASLPKFNKEQQEEKEINLDIEKCPTCHTKSERIFRDGRNVCAVCGYPWNIINSSSSKGF